MKEKSIIVKFNGGLGNQMFQWAFARSLAQKTGLKVMMDMSYFSKGYARAYELGIFNLKMEPVRNLWTKFKLALIWKFRRKLEGKKFLGLKLYSEPDFQYDENLFSQVENTFIEGFFQSEKYFEDMESVLRQDFQYKISPDEENQEMIEKILSTNSISLHIRRGDYVQKKQYQSFYTVCSLDYYKRAVEYIAQTVENPVLFIFSDDPKWVKDNLKLPYESVYVAHNKGSKSYEDMRLMSLCKHNVIANSSFSWWGAWLNNNVQKIVIAPQKWINDESINQDSIVPEKWVKLEN